MQDEILPHLKVTCKSHVLLVEVRGSVNMERVEIFDFSLGSGSQTSLSCISILSCPSVLDWAHFTIKPKNMNSSSLCIGSWVITPAKGPHSLQGYPQWAFWIERFFSSESLPAWFPLLILPTLYELPPCLSQQSRDGDTQSCTAQSPVSSDALVTSPGYSMGAGWTVKAAFGVRPAKYWLIGGHGYMNWCWRMWMRSAHHLNMFQSYWYVVSPCKCCLQSKQIHVLLSMFTI